MNLLAMFSIGLCFIGVFAWIGISWKSMRARKVVQQQKKDASLWKSEAGNSLLASIMTAMLLAFIGILFVINFVPEIEAAILAATITNTFTAALVDMAEWLIPVVAVVAIFIAMFSLIKNRSSSF